MTMQRFRDRQDAGQQLAQYLQAYLQWEEMVEVPGVDSDQWAVIGLARGGVAVACEVALALQVPLDTCVVRKLGLPTQPELAMGAITTGFQWIDKPFIQSCKVSRAQLLAVLQQEQQRLHQRQVDYAPYRPQMTLEGRHLIVIDDGIATGATLRVALMALRSQHPAQIIVAVPVMSPSPTVDHLVAPNTLLALHQPQQLLAVGYAYENFAQVSDEAVCQALQRANALRQNGVAAGPAAGADTYAEIAASNTAQADHRSVPPAAPH